MIICLKSYLLGFGVKYRNSHPKSKLPLSAHDLLQVELNVLDDLINIDFLIHRFILAENLVQPSKFDVFLIQPFKYYNL